MVEWPLLSGGEKEMNFCIKEGYVDNLNPKYCNRKKSSIKNQLWIYEKASKLDDYETVIDLGCGYGEKLMHFFKDYNTIGFDYGKNIEFCKDNLPDRQWKELNLETESPESYEKALILCVDVIEHLIDPTCLLNYMSTESKKNKMIMSTPNRAKRRGKEKTANGPPSTGTHVREWTKDEFQALMDQFEIELTVEEEGRYLIAS